MAEAGCILCVNMRVDVFCEDGSSEPSQKHSKNNLNETFKDFFKNSPSSIINHRNWKQSECPSAGEWIHYDTMEYDTEIKRNM